MTTAINADLIRAEGEGMVTAPPEPAKAAKPWVVILTHRSLGGQAQMAHKNAGTLATFNLHSARRFATRAEAIAWVEANRAAIDARQFSAYSWDTEANLLPWNPEA